MSDIKSATNGAKTGTKPQRSEEEVVDLAAIDDALDRLRKKLSSNLPYIVSTTTEKPLPYPMHQASHSFRMGGLFDANEEDLQFRSYRYRDPGLDLDLYRLKPGFDQSPALSKRPEVRAGNASAQGPKKKMDFNAYKSKQANGIITPGSKKPSPTLVPTKPAPAETNGIKTVKSSSEAPKVAAPPSEKPKKISKQLEKPAEDAPPPTKKPRRESSPKHVPDITPSDATPHGLPPLLSPVGASLGNPYDLPPILSPTLPPVIQVELERMRKRAQSDASTSSSDKKSVDSLDKKSVDSLDKQSHIVKLKFTRRAAAAQALLRLPPARKAPSIEKKEPREAVHERPNKPEPLKTLPKAADAIPVKSKNRAEAVQRKTDTPTPTPKTNGRVVSEKRARAEDDAGSAVPAKKQKSQSAQDKPSTPAHLVTTSPALSNKSSAQKSQGAYATPRKDLKAINMIRQTSTDGNDSTPGRSVSTPASAKPPDIKAGPTSAPAHANGVQHAEYLAYCSLSKKFNDIGRELKYEVERLYKMKDQKQLMAVKAMECLLAYVLAYTVDDHARHSSHVPTAAVEKTWCSLYKLCHSFTNLTRGYQNLRALNLYMGTVICNSILQLVSKRARARTSEKPEKSGAHDSPQDSAPVDPAVNEALLAKHYPSMVAFMQEANTLLSTEAIQSNFPKTWAGRATKLQSDKFTTSSLEGPYYLPINITTTPLQAARFGIQFLTEFCSKERLEWTRTIHLKNLA